MSYEEKLASFIKNVRYEDLGERELDIVRKEILTIVGCVIAGNSDGGCREVVGQAKQLGGAEEATILVHGGKVPAQNAAFVNGVMARALDICDHIKPGMHVGSGMVPAVYAAAELKGGVSGKDFVTAVAVGTEVALRFNLPEKEYNGFDPTGVAAVFGAAAGVAKVFDLSEREILHTLALVLNRAGGSFQSNADGALAVRVIEGWIAQAAVECARLAQMGITGPVNFLDGKAGGYFHIFTDDRVKSEDVFATLGQEWLIPTIGFKKYPSCGLTQSCTECAVKLMDSQGITADDIERMEITLAPQSYKLTGHFELGDNPKVNAQFSTPYCVANAFVRRPVTLAQFDPEYINDDRVLSLVERTETFCDENIGHYTTVLTVFTKDGRKLVESYDKSPGTADDPQGNADFENRFFDCSDYSKIGFIQEREGAIYDACSGVDELEDISELFGLLNE